MAPGETIIDNSSEITGLQPTLTQHGCLTKLDENRPWHDENNRFAHGNPGGGRPASIVLTDYLRNKLENSGYSAKIGDAIVEAAAGEKLMKPGQLDAANTLMDRVYGRAVQNTNLRAVVVMMPADAALAETWDAAEPD